MVLSCRCPVHNYKARLTCDLCLVALENGRVLKARYLAGLHAENAARRLAPAAAPVKRQRWDNAGRCSLHGVDPLWVEVRRRDGLAWRRLCPRCSSERSKQGIRTRREQERHKRHDAGLPAPAIDCGDVWEVFTAEVFRAHA